MLKLRRARVVSADPLTVTLDGAAPGEIRRAWADESLVGACEPGDEVVVNTEALDLGLGSGGFDVVHVNLTRGLDADGSQTEHVMKLNYSSLQHPVATIERRADGPADSGPAPDPPTLGAPSAPGAQSVVPVLALGLHGHLAPAAWAFGRPSGHSGISGVEGDGRPLRVGYIQTAGGALPGSLSRDVANLLERGLLAGHVTAGPAYGGKDEAITLTGAIDAARSLGWDAAIAGPGPGILGSATAYGHGGMAALDVLHSALALGSSAVLSLRFSSGDPRPRHQGLSHHSKAVLGLCLGPVEVPLPDRVEGLLGQSSEPGLEEMLAAIGRGGHRVTRHQADLDGYGESGLPRRTMGRDLADDPAFFAGPLAAGRRLAEVATD
ncbi:MAG: DUF3866 family protein [Actinomycetota bacterium]|nr:DUF3866 family protein [Actinomycetota bacterium]